MDDVSIVSRILVAFWFSTEIVISYQPIYYYSILEENLITDIRWRKCMKKRIHWGRFNKKNSLDGCTCTTVVWSWICRAISMITNSSFIHNWKEKKTIICTSHYQTNALNKSCKLLICVSGISATCSVRVMPQLLV